MIRYLKVLYKHISSLCKKIKLGINQSPIMAQDIKIKYPFAFELANIAKKDNRKRFEDRN